MSDEIKTWRDLLALGAKAAGVDMATDKRFAELMQNEALAAPIRASFTDDWEDLTFKFGKSHPGLKRHYEDEIGSRNHGTWAAMSERAFRQKAKEHGFDTTVLDQLIEETKGRDFKPRWEGIADFFFKGGIAKGEESAKSDRGDDALKLELKQAQSQVEQWKKDAEAIKAEYEARLSERDNQMKSLGIKHALDRQVRSQIKFNSSYTPGMVNAYINEQLGAIQSKYNIINKNGEFLPFDKEDPTKVATNPDTGRALTLNDVLAAHFPEEIRQKQPEGGGGGGNGHTPIVGGKKVDPRFKHVAKWAESIDLPEGK